MKGVGDGRGMHASMPKGKILPKSLPAPLFPSTTRHASIRAPLDPLPHLAATLASPPPLSSTLLWPSGCLMSHDQAIYT
jgi:hypothetical protein